MTSRERVLQSLRHESTDRVPVDVGATRATGMHVSCVAKLRNHFGFSDRPVKVVEPRRMLGEIDAELIEALGVDTAAIMPRRNIFGSLNERWKEWKMPGGQVVEVPGDFNTTKDKRGTVYAHPEGDLEAPASGRMPRTAHTFEIVPRREPVDEDSLDPEDNLEEFQPIGDDDIAYYERELRQASRLGRAVVADFGGTSFGNTALVSAPFLKHPRGIRSMREWHKSVRSRKDYVHQVFEKQVKTAMANLDKISMKVGHFVDVVMVCDTDLAGQSSLLFPRDVIREMYMPYYQRLNRWVHENTGWSTMKHTRGAVEPIIGDLIECGFDIISPVQCSAANMDAGFLKNKYGDDIVFWGGGVDTQETLLSGKPREIADRVARRCETFSPNGGFVFGTVGVIQPNTPVANIVAMFEAAGDFNGG